MFRKAHAGYPTRLPKPFRLCAASLAGYSILGIVFCGLMCSGQSNEVLYPTWFFFAPPGTQAETVYMSNVEIVGASGQLLGDYVMVNAQWEGIWDVRGGWPCTLLPENWSGVLLHFVVVIEEETTGFLGIREIKEITTTVFYHHGYPYSQIHQFARSSDSTIEDRYELNIPCCATIDQLTAFKRLVCAPVMRLEAGHDGARIRAKVKVKSSVSADGHPCSTFAFFGSPVTHSEWSGWGYSDWVTVSFGDSPSPEITDIQLNRDLDATTGDIVHYFLRGVNRGGYSWKTWVSLSLSEGLEYVPGSTVVTGDDSPEYEAILYPAGTLIQDRDGQMIKSDYALLDIEIVGLDRNDEIGVTLDLEVSECGEQWVKSRMTSRAALPSEKIVNFAAAESTTLDQQGWPTIRRAFAVKCPEAAADASSETEGSDAQSSWSARYPDCYAYEVVGNLVGKRPKDDAHPAIYIHFPGDTGLHWLADGGVDDSGFQIRALPIDPVWESEDHSWGASSSGAYYIDAPGVIAEALREAYGTDVELQIRYVLGGHYSLECRDRQTGVLLWELRSGEWFVCDDGTRMPALVEPVESSYVGGSTWGTTAFPLAVIERLGCDYRICTDSHGEELVLIMLKGEDIDDYCQIHDLSCSAATSIPASSLTPVTAYFYWDPVAEDGSSESELDAMKQLVATWVDLGGLSEEEVLREVYAGRLDDYFEMRAASGSGDLGSGVKVNCVATRDYWGAGIIRPSDGARISLSYVIRCHDVLPNRDYVWVFKYFDEHGNLLRDIQSLHVESDGVLSLGPLLERGQVVEARSPDSSPDQITWTTALGGSFPEYNVYAVREVQGGGCVVTGWAPSKDNGDDAWLTKIGRDGSVLWSKTYGIEEHDERFVDVVETPDGGFVLAGTAEWSELVPGEGLLIWGGSALELTRLDANGEQLWHREFTKTGARYTHGGSVRLAVDGGYFVQGSLSYSFDDNSLWLIRTDSKGRVLWDRVFGKRGFEDTSYLHDFDLTPDGGCVIVGSYETPTADGRSMSTPWLVRTDSSGNFIWDRSYYRESSTLREVRARSQGGFVLVGETRSESADGAAVWLLELNDAGDIQWEGMLQRGSSDRGISLELTPDGGYTVLAESLDETWQSRCTWLLHLTAARRVLWERTYNEASTWGWALSLERASDGGYFILDSVGLPMTSGDNVDTYFLLMKTDESGVVE
jgi:hypothetical protein